MSNRVFVDTNILLRAIISTHPEHNIVRPFVNRYVKQGFELCINGQVVREYFNQITRPQTFMKPIAARRIATYYVGVQSAFKILAENNDVVDKFVQLLARHPTGGKQVHDANLVATMLVYGIDTLLTINVRDLKRFQDEITIVSPMPPPPT